MRDENEGFAKLTVEIAEANYEDDASESRISNILSLIGYFDLDPDTLLYSFSSKMNYDYFLFCGNSDLVSWQAFISSLVMKPTFHKEHPPICRITAYATVPGSCMILRSIGIFWLNFGDEVDWSNNVRSKFIFFLLNAVRSKSAVCVCSFE